MKTIFTILLYFAIGSIVAFIVGIAIQTIQSRNKQSNTDHKHRKRKGERYNRLSK